ncbi:MAG: Gfo/Idh/MocA family oxidoreductase [Planctomycetota bacterium]
MNKQRQTSRRCFLQAGAAVATGLLASNRAAASTPPSDRLAIALVGCGGIGRWHAQNFPPAIAIRAIADLDQQHLASMKNDFAPDAVTTDDYRELIGRDDIDAVFVCTPDHWHCRIACDALEAGKDVYCEKPLTLTIDEGRILSEVVARTGRVCQVGTQQRSDPNFQTAVALAHSGRVGKLRRVTAAIGAGPPGGPFSAEPAPKRLAWDRWLGQAPAAEYRPQRCHGNFRWWYEYSGGKMTDWGAHHVDIAQWAIAPEDERPIAIEVIHAEHASPLEGGMPVRDDSYNTATTFHLRCRFADGVELDIRDTATDLGFDNGLLFEGEEGRYFVNRGKLTGGPVEKLKSSPLADDATFALRKGQPIDTHYMNFYRACRDRSEPISDVVSHVRHLNTCHAANIAMRLGQSLVWRPEEMSFGDESLNPWRQRRARDGYSPAAL